MWDKSGLAGCSLKDTKCVLNYFRGWQLCSTIINSGLIQVTAFSFENIVGIFRRYNSQKLFFVIISAFSYVSVWMMNENIWKGMRFQTKQTNVDEVLIQRQRKQKGDSGNPAVNVLEENCAQQCGHFSSTPGELWVADEIDRWTKFRLELFENIDVTISVLIQSAGAQHTQSCYRLKVMVFTSIHRIRVDRRKRCENVMCGRAFFLKTKKNICVFKRMWILVDVANSQ